MKAFTVSMMLLAVSTGALANDTSEKCKDENWYVFGEVATFRKPVKIDELITEFSPGHGLMCWITFNVDMDLERYRVVKAGRAIMLGEVEYGWKVGLKQDPPNSVDRFYPWVSFQVFDPHVHKLTCESLISTRDPNEKLSLMDLKARLADFVDLDYDIKPCKPESVAETPNNNAPIAAEAAVK